MAKSAEKDREAAKYMKARPGQFPDSAMRPWGGEGAGIRKLAHQMNASGHRTGTWDRGMIGGVLAARLGFSDRNVPADLIGRISNAA